MSPEATSVSPERSLSPPDYAAFLAARSLVEILRGRQREFVWAGVQIGVVAEVGVDDIKFRATCANPDHRKCFCWINPRKVVWNQIQLLCDLAEWLYVGRDQSGLEHQTVASALKIRYGIKPWT